MNLKEIKVIKIMPFRGLNKELIIEGIKSKVTLYEDSLGYKVKYTKNIILIEEDPLGISDNSDKETEVKYYSEEEGIIEKSSIDSIIKYLETRYDKDKTPYYVYFLDITFNGGSITLDTGEEKERNSLYTDLINWKFNNEK